MRIIWPPQVAGAATERTLAQQRRKRASREANRWREDVFFRDGFRCVYCGDTLRPRRLDHDVPVSRDGPSTPDNLVCACEWCDRLKGDMTGAEFRALPRILGKAYSAFTRGVNRP